MKQVIKTIEPQDMADPMKYHLRPGQWLGRVNGSDLKRGSGPFEVFVDVKPKNQTRKATVRKVRE